MKKHHFVLLLYISTIFFSCKKNNVTQGPDGGGQQDSGVTILAAKPVTKTNNQKVYVHYMPWFENKSTSPDGKWGMHWSMANENPDVILSNGNRQIASYFYPMIGPYASSDRDVIDYHTLLMKYAGIDGVIVDWGGSHNVYDYPLNRRNTDSLFNRMPSVGYSLQFVMKMLLYDM